MPAGPYHFRFLQCKTIFFLHKTAHPFCSCSDFLWIDVLWCYSVIEFVHKILWRDKLNLYQIIKGCYIPFLHPPKALKNLEFTLYRNICQKWVFKWFSLILLIFQTYQTFYQLQRRSSSKTCWKMKLSNYQQIIVFTKILYFLTRISRNGLNPFLHSTPIHFAKLFSWSVWNAHFQRFEEFLQFLIYYNEISLYICLIQDLSTLFSTFGDPWWLDLLSFDLCVSFHF